MKTCFIVIHRNYAEGLSAYAFWNRKDAEKSVQADVKTTEINLKTHYEPITLIRNADEAEVYVPGNDIYYEWNIFESDIC